MKRYRSVLSLLLAAIAIFLVSCGNPTPTVKGPTYTPAQLEEIQTSATSVKEFRDKMLSIPPLVQQQEWVDLSSYIHGPLGELRFRMVRLARLLEPKLQPTALKVAKDVFGHLNLIDEAAQSFDAKKAFLNYNEALKDFDAFLKLLPPEIS